uniref:Pathogenesis-related protein 10 n=1 Tax=Crocus sativus TaxID=82528 RepID=E5D8G2_CROSA|nr:pathogenesis-related protein 10 [Crocus sativus]
MTTVTWSHEIESSADPAPLFKASMLDWHNLAPKIWPDIVVSSTAVSGGGNHSIGSVRQLNFAPGVRPFAFVKERLDFIDMEKLECKSSLVEGGLIGVKLESISFHYKFEAASNGGCIVKLTVTLKTLAGAVAEGETESTKEGVTKRIKAVEAYLLANPTAYA